MYVTCTLLLTLIGGLWLYNKKRFMFWSSKGVKGPEPRFIFGHALEIWLWEKWTFIRENYDRYKEDKLFGIYEWYKPILFLCDLDLIKQILIKDFPLFVNRREFDIPESLDVVKYSLNSLRGDQWKKIRTIMSPTFSSGKIKQMYETVYKQTDIFLQFCKDNAKPGENFNMKDTFGRFTMDVIATCAFGIDSGSLENKTNFSHYAEKAFPTGKIANILNLCFLLSPRVTFMIGDTLEKIFKTQNPWIFFIGVGEKTMEERRKEIGKVKDFIDMMLELQEKEIKEGTSKILTDKIILAQVIIFLIAGYDTTASTLSIAAHYLSKHPKQTQILREELKEIVSEDGYIDYYKLMEAKYLDACISETLRLNPPLPTLERESLEDYKIENSNLIIPKGTLLFIPVWGIHRDPAYWKNPDDFIPERFLPENKDDITPMSYMPFGLGPRNCIAMRFGLMEVKLCLARFVLNYEFTPAPGHEELKIANGTIVKPEEGSIQLVLNNINECS